MEPGATASETTGLSADGAGSGSAIALAAALGTAAERLRRCAEEARAVRELFAMWQDASAHGNAISSCASGVGGEGAYQAVAVESDAVDGPRGLGAQPVDETVISPRRRSWGGEVDLTLGKAELACKLPAGADPAPVVRRRLRAASPTAAASETSCAFGVQSPCRISPSRNHRVASIGTVPTCAQRGAQRKGEELEAAMADCEKQLDMLERRAADGPRPCDAVGSGEAWVPMLRADCQKLCRRLETLAADALECGCGRNIPGAMDVFEQANAGLERLVGVLEYCSAVNSAAAVQCSDARSEQGGRFDSWRAGPLLPKEALGGGQVATPARAVATSPAPSPVESCLSSRLVGSPGASPSLTSSSPIAPCSGELLRDRFVR